MSSLTQIERYVFDTTGLLVRRGVLPRRDIEAAYDCLVEKIPAGTWKFPTLPNNSLFWDWMMHPDIVDAVREMCGPNVRLDHAFGLCSVKDNPSAKQLHGGRDSSQLSCFYHDIGQPLGLVGQLSVGIPLTRQDKSTGGVCYLPGSHKAFDRTEGKLVFTDWLKRDMYHDAVVVPTLEPGDIVFFTESLVHGDTGCRTANPRWTAYYKFTPGWMCWRDPAQQEPYRQRAVTPTIRRLMEPPWTGRYEEQDGVKMSTSNTRREPT